MEDQHPNNGGTQSDDSSSGPPIPTESQEDQKKSIGENSKTEDHGNNTNNEPDVLVFQKTLRKIWYRIKSPDFQGGAMAVSTIAIAFFTAATWIVILTGSSDTHDLAVSAGKQADEATIQAQAAKDQVAGILESNKINKSAFDRAYRPYVGINSVLIWFTLPSGQISSIPTKDAISMSFRVEIKNFGPVPGSAFQLKWDEDVGGIKSPGKGTAYSPSTIFPGQSTSLDGVIGTINYPDVRDGRKKVTFRLSADYEGPQGHEKYCSRNQYAADRNIFVFLGNDCP